MMDLGKKKDGKVGTRGAQQIARENVKTITLYRNIILGVNGITFLIMKIQFASFLQSSTEIGMLLLLLLFYFGCFQYLFQLGTPKTSEPDGKGQLIEPGLDLNMDDGMTEHVKDAIILAATAQIVSPFMYVFGFWNYYWLALSFALIRIFLWMVWKPIIAPWFLAPERGRD